MFKRSAATLLLFILLGIQAAYADVAGVWNLVYKPKPKITVTAFGQPIPAGKVKLPELPTTDVVEFTPDAGFPGTGGFSNSLFPAGVWKQKGTLIKGTPTQTVIEQLMNGYLQQGSLYGFSFSGGRFLGAKNRMIAKELKDGTLKGTFQHVSKWSIAITEPKKMTVKLQVKLLANFKGTRVAQ